MTMETFHRPAARTGLIIAGLSTMLVLAGCSSEDSTGQQGGGGLPPAAVTVETAELNNATIRQDYAGRARGAREVQVRARVSGVLEERQDQYG